MTPPALTVHFTVNKPLTPKRRTRVVENDEYAAFLRRVIRAYGYSWADIAMRLGITRQGTQQRWGDDTRTAAPVTTPGSTPADWNCP